MNSSQDKQTITDNAYKNFIQSINYDSDCCDDCDSVESDFCEEPQTHHTRDLEKYEDVVKYSKPLRISTMTKIVYLNNSNIINIDKLFWLLPIINYNSFQTGIVKKNIKINSNSIEYTNEIQEIVDKLHADNTPNFSQTILKKTKKKNVYKQQQIIRMGISNKDIKKKDEKTKAFFNCIAMFIRIKIDTGFKEIHVKIFNTGKLEIPGIKNNDILYKILYYIVDLLNKLNSNNIIISPNNKINFIESSIKNILINSNFNCGYFISRENLFDILVHKYNMTTSFDACRYTGMKCKFYYNSIKDVQDGICECRYHHNNSDNTEDKLKPCTKKGSGSGIGQCKIISIMIFRTGSVMIVGNCTQKMLYIIYEHIKKILIDEFNNVNNGGITEDIIKKKSKHKYIKYIVDI